MIYLATDRSLVGGLQVSGLEFEIDLPKMLDSKASDSIAEGSKATNSKASSSKAMDSRKDSWDRNLDATDLRNGNSA